MTQGEGVTTWKSDPVVDGAVIARGRDSYFPPWPDVAQLDAFAPALRRAAAATLLDEYWTEVIGSVRRVLLAWSWADGEQRSLIVINDADQPAAGRVHVRWDDIGQQDWRLSDLLTGDVFVRDGTELADSGLYVQLPPWGSHVLACEMSSEALDDKQTPA